MTGPWSSALAEAIVAMAHSLGIETVAEGIETAEQAARMQTLDCTYGQGYYYAMPLRPEEIPGFALTTATVVATAASDRADGAETGLGDVPAPATRARRRRTGEVPTTA